MARPVAPPSFNRIFLFLWSGVFVLQPVPRRFRKESHIVLAESPVGENFP